MALNSIPAASIAVDNKNDKVADQHSVHELNFNTRIKIVYTMLPCKFLQSSKLVEVHIGKGGDEKVYY